MTSPTNPATPTPRYLTVTRQNQSVRIAIIAYFGSILSLETSSEDKHRMGDILRTLTESECHYSVDYKSVYFNSIFSKSKSLFTIRFY